MALITLPFMLLALVGISYTLAAAALVGRWRPGPAPAIDDGPAVTLLKPLYGAEPKLVENLGTFLRQDYAGDIQMLCGVGSADDAAVGAVDALRSKPFVSSPSTPPAASLGTGFSLSAEVETRSATSLDFARDERKGEDTTINLSIGSRTYGTNGKISNLANMQPHAKHGLLVLSDSDIAVAPDYLARIAAAIAPSDVGAVTCLYAGRGDAGPWSRMAAGGISYQFLPSVMVGLATGLARPCMGSTIAIRRGTLDAIGGFDPFADKLADDHAIGAAVRGLGLKVVVPPMLVLHGCTETNFAALARHELRWNATVRDLDPAGFVGSVVTFPVPLALIALMLGGASWASLLLLAALVARLVLKIRVDRLAGFQALPSWLLPVRDTVSFMLFLATFCVRSVDWRGARLRMEKDGRVSAGSES